MDFQQYINIFPPEKSNKTFVPETPRDKIEVETAQQQSFEMSSSFNLEPAKNPHTDRPDQIWAPSQLYSQLEDESQNQ